MAKTLPDDEAPEGRRIIDPTASLDAPQPALATPMLTLSLEQLEHLIDRATRASREGQGEGGELLRLAAESLRQVGDEVKRTVRRSNATHPGISAFSHPEGDEAHPKAPLRYETFFCGGRQREDQLTPTEIELFNKFEHSMEAGGGRYRATLEKNGSKMVLHVWAPCKTLDDMAAMPPLTQMLSELLYGSEIADPSQAMARLLDAERRISELMATVAKLEGAHGAPGAAFHASA